MAFLQYAVVLAFLFLTLSPTPSSQSIIQMTPKKTQLSSDGISSHRRRGIDLYCESWKFTVETNDAGFWTQIPENCVDFVQEYITGERYLAETAAVADNALAYAKGVGVGGNGKDAWVFDIDETLLSNVPYYADHGYGYEVFNETSFDEWVDLAIAPAIPASLRFYKGLQELGFTIVLLTGRAEFQRKCTGDNLQYAGFKNWERLYLRGDSDHGKTASLYKSEKRKELEDEGYIIHGNSGDQWSDLTGFAVAARSFKLPNPMYFIA